MHAGQLPDRLEDPGRVHATDQGLPRHLSPAVQTATPARPQSSSRRGRIFVGTSGFSYAGWRGSFYPKGTGGPRMLAFYATRLPAVELNTTFHGNPTPAAIDQWAGSVPEGFRFAVKAHRMATYAVRPQFVEGEMALMRELMPLFRDRLGPILFQFPPTEYVQERWERVLRLIPSDWRAAFQFRHASWYRPEVLAAVAETGGAICHTDGDPESGPLGVGRFCYVRLRRERYGKVRMRRWAAQLQEWADGGRDVYAFLKHEELGPLYAMSLLSLASQRTWTHSAL